MNYVDGYFWYEPSLIRPDPTFVEIGSRSGQVSKELIKRHPTATVLVYEASRANYKELVEATRGLRVVAHNEAVTGQDGTTTFYEYDNWESNSVFARHNIQAHRRLKSTTTVPSTSLRTVLASAPGNYVDVLFTNCEGAELYLAKELTLHEQVRQGFGQLCISFHGRIVGHDKVKAALAKLSRYYAVIPDERGEKYDCTLLVRK